MKDRAEQLADELLGTDKYLATYNMNRDMFCVRLCRDDLLALIRKHFPQNGTRGTNEKKKRSRNH